MKNQLAESIHIEFNDNSVLSSLFGVLTVTFNY